jgi:hypothetical protein
MPGRKVVLKSFHCDSAPLRLCVKICIVPYGEHPTAIQPVWADGHAPGISGIYSFDYLKWAADGQVK